VVVLVAVGIVVVAVLGGVSVLRMLRDPDTARYRDPAESMLWRRVYLFAAVSIVLLIAGHWRAAIGVGLFVPVFFWLGRAGRDGSRFRRRGAGGHGSHPRQPSAGSAATDPERTPRTSVTRAAMAAVVVVLLALGMVALQSISSDSDRVADLQDHGVEVPGTIQTISGSGAYRYAYSWDGRLHQESGTDGVAGFYLGAPVTVLVDPDDPARSMVKR
jgi:hypothetical protein